MIVVKYSLLLFVFFIFCSPAKAEKYFERDMVERLVRLETKLDNNNLLVFETKKDLPKQIDEIKTGLQEQIDDSKNEIRLFEYGHLA